MAVLIFGTDPGVNGAAALVHCHGGGRKADVEDVLRLHDRDATALTRMARAAALIVVEAQHAAPGQGGVSAFTLGMAYGWLQGVLDSVRGARVISVQPAVWRGSYGLPGGAFGKRQGIAMARSVSTIDRPGLTHDEADAILLAWWGWRNVVLCGSSSAV
jgi:hypothetical protein